MRPARYVPKSALAVVLLLLGSCSTAPAGEGGIAVAAAYTASFDDECVSEPRYLQFRTQLRAVVAAKDGTAFRALFHTKGAMRVNGIGGNATTPDWGFDRPAAQAVWDELQQILTLGCVRQGDRLLLPAMAALIDAGISDSVVALSDVPLRKQPDGAALILGILRKGATATWVIYDDPPGWTQLLVNGRPAYATTINLRSPTSYLLSLSSTDAGWRISEFNSGV